MLLLRGDFVFQIRKPFAQLRNFIFKTQNIVRASFNFVPQIFDGGIFLRNFRKQNIKLMPRELRFEVLQFQRNLFIAFRLAGLALQRTDLAFHFLDRVGDA